MNNTNSSASFSVIFEISKDFVVALTGRDGLVARFTSESAAFEAACKLELGKRVGFKVFERTTK